MAAQDSERKVIQKKRRQAWNNGLSRVRLQLTPETKATLQAYAKQSGLSFSEVVNIALMQQLRKRREEEAVRETVAEAFDEEYKRIEAEVLRINDPVERMHHLVFEVFPSLKRRMRKIQKRLLQKLQKDVKH